MVAVLDQNISQKETAYRNSSCPHHDRDCRCFGIRDLDVLKFSEKWHKLECVVNHRQDYGEHH